MASQKKRVDQVLVERGIVESRHKAQALLLAGQVLVDEQKIEKPGHRIDVEAAIRIIGETPFVSRAGAKLQAALDYFHIQVADRICVDLGASTGGFTDCLLQNGAREVHAFDVGKDQLAWKLRSDPRVVVHDDYNVRHLAGDDLPQGATLVTVDLSFISLTKVLGQVKEALRARAGNVAVDLILLVKPQFEVGRGQVGRGGIVRDAAKRLAAVESTADFARSFDFVVEGVIPSPIPGTKGNQEFLMYLKLPPDLSSTL